MAVRHLGWLVAGLLAMPAALAGPATLDKAVSADHRTDKYVARDGARHPAQVLDFFGVDADDTVVEIWPSAGYWAEILGPFLASSGQYVAAQFGVGPADTPWYRRRNHGQLLIKLADVDTYGKAIVTTVDTPDQWTMAEPGSADVVLTFRNVHNWMGGQYAERMFAAAHTALQPGGVLGVVEHRAKPGTTRKQMIKSGYVTEAEVIRLAESAGFKLAERSEINANPKDTADHPRGVWTLPPSLALGETDRAKYLAIGESDRMTLKFVKLLGN